MVTGLNYCFYLSEWVGAPVVGGWETAPLERVGVMRHECPNG